MGAAQTEPVNGSTSTQPEKLLSIGQVLTRLGASFPDLTPSKLRFLEEQGLVSPRRTESGYRKYSAQDVERVRFVLALQRDHYLPLKVIKQYLADVDAGRSTPLPGLVSGVDTASIQQVKSVYSRDDLIAQTGASSTLVSECVALGLLPTARRYDDSAVRVLRALVALGEYGIAPRHLRGFRAMIDREVGLIESVVRPVIAGKSDGSRAQAAKRAEEVMDNLESVRRALVIGALKGLLS